MSDDIDRHIDEALEAEERELLKAIGEEPGYWSQIWGIFGGRLGWVNLLLAIVQGAMFIAGVYAAVRFFNADEPVEALQWGLPSAVLIIVAAMTKYALWPSLHTNRVLRELKRIELQIANLGLRE